MSSDELTKRLLLLMSNLHRRLLETDLKVATCESITGGLLARLFTYYPNASRYFKGGLVLYSEDSKVRFGIPKNLITRYGTISSQVALHMSKLAMEMFDSDIAIALTGNAGPYPIEGKPIGLIYVSIHVRGAKPIVNRVKVRSKTRDGVKRIASAVVIKELLKLLD